MHTGAGASWGHDAWAQKVREERSFSAVVLQGGFIALLELSAKVDELSGTLDP